MRKNLSQKVLYSSGTLVNLWAECFNTECNTSSHVGRSQHRKVLQKLLNGGNPSVRYVQIPDSHTCIRVPDTIREAFEPRAISVALLCTFLFCKHTTILEISQAIELSGRCVIWDDEFLIKQWRNATRVNMGQ